MRRNLTCSLERCTGYSTGGSWSLSSVFLSYTVAAAVASLFRLHLLLKKCNLLLSQAYNLASIVEAFYAVVFYSKNNGIIFNLLIQKNLEQYTTLIVKLVLCDSIFKFSQRISEIKL